MLKMTLDSYINNPMGDRVMTQKTMYKQLYTEKFDKLILRENNKVEYYLYRSNSKDIYAIHMKVPSEALTGMYYDVVLEFSPINNDSKAESTLRHYNVKFFSNDRAFVFTYAYAFKHHGLLIDGLDSKLGIAVKDKPEKTNPKLLIGYVKAFYFAYLIMNLKGLFNKSAFEANLHNYSISTLKTKIASSQEKMIEYDELKAKVQKSKRANKIHNKGEKIDLNGDKDQSDNHIIGKVKTITKIQPIKKLSSKIHIIGKKKR